MAVGRSTTAPAPEGHMYWKKAVERTFPGVTNLSEDWDDSEIRFDAGRSLTIPKNLQVFGNDVEVSVSLREGGVHSEMTLRVILRNVNFPETPG